jgi:hypothetical protein
MRVWREADDFAQAQIKRQSEGQPIGAMALCHKDTLVGWYPWRHSLGATST